MPRLGSEKVIRVIVCRDIANHFRGPLFRWDQWRNAMTYSLMASLGIVARAGTAPEGLPIDVQIVPQH